MFQYILPNLQKHNTYRHTTYNYKIKHIIVTEHWTEVT